MVTDVFLCELPPSPPSSSSSDTARSTEISPISFQPIDFIPVKLNSPLPFNPISPVERPTPTCFTSPLTPLSETPPRLRRTLLRKSHIPLPLPTSSPESDLDDIVPIFTTRTFPGHNIPQPPLYSLLYRRFPVSSFYAATDANSAITLFNRTHPGGTYNPPRSPLDLYTPRFVRGKGTSKHGLCPICLEPRARGGASSRVWLAMKFSAYKYYHMQYFHGISASTQRPFSPPIAFRTIPRLNAGKNERKAICEAKCHKCSKWVPIEGVKDVQPKVKELFWWKHAAMCHGSSSLDDPDDIFEHDSVHAVLSKL